MGNWIEECQRNFGNAPREFRLWDRLTYMRVAMPSWLRSEPKDQLRILFQNVKKCFSDGVVVWAHIIQANQLMFEVGNDNCPGELVYSVEDGARIEFEELAQVAYALGQLKGTKPEDPQLAPIANYLTDEYIRVFGLPVPHKISPKFRCRISTTYFVRKHLPARRLCTPLLPVVVYPHEPYVAMILPERYWPVTLLDWWVNRGAN